MKYALLTLQLGLLLAICVPLLMAGAIVLNFQAQAGYNQVSVKWTTQNEQNLKGFEVQRSFDNTSDSNFRKIAFVNADKSPKQNKEYIYVDRTVFKSADRTFYYRLKLIDNDERQVSFSKVLTVTPTVSSARQTWGSIKAMFR
jgi:hypothetical protein